MSARRGAVGAVLTAVLVATTACASTAAGGPTTGPAGARSTASTVPVPASTTTTLPPVASVAWVVEQPTGLGAPTTLVPVDPARGTAGTPVVLGSVTGVTLAALDPSGTTAYLVGAPGLVAVGLPSGATRVLWAAASMPEAPVTSLAESPDGTTLYLTVPSAAPGHEGDAGLLYPVELATGRVGRPVVLPGISAACADGVTDTAVTPDGQDVYVLGVGGLVDVDVAAGTSSPNVAVPGTAGAATSFGVTPDGATVAVALGDLDAGGTADQVSLIRTAGDTPGPVFPVRTSPHVTPAGDDGPRSPAVDAVDVVSDRTALLVTEGTTPEQVIPVDLTTGAQGRAVTLSTAGQSVPCSQLPPSAVAISPVGVDAVVTDPSLHGVHDVRLADGAIGPEIPVGGVPVSVLIPGGWPTSSWFGP